MFRKILILMISALGLIFVSASCSAWGWWGAQKSSSSSANGFNPQQTQQIQKIVHDYLLANPEILMEVGKKLQQKQMQAQQTKANQAITANYDALFNSPSTPAVLNPKGKVTLIEFSDYQCLICMRMYPVVEKVIKAHPNLRVVFKDFPIFGPASTYAAKAAIAAGLQGKYLAFHNAMFTSALNGEHKIEGSMKNTDVDAQLAKVGGLNLAKIKTDMQSQQVANTLKANAKLAMALQLQGTPAFVIGPTTANSTGKVTFVPGGTSAAALDSAITAAAK